MPDSGVLIIDDVDESLARMTAFGRTLVHPFAEAIRDAVRKHAARRGWAVVRHRAYAEWAAEQVTREHLTWLSLDPLLDAEQFGGTARNLRVTRTFHDNQAVFSTHFTLDGGADHPVGWGNSGDVGIVDDAAASGSTLKYVAEVVTQNGGNVTRIVLAASARGARTLVRRAAADGRWTEFVAGDWSVAHMRDESALTSHIRGDQHRSHLCVEPMVRRWKSEYRRAPLPGTYGKSSQSIPPFGTRLRMRAPKLRQNSVRRSDERRVSVI